MESAPGEFPPRVKLVGIADPAVKDVETAYAAARESPNDAKKVGELGIIYYSCVQEPMAASECFVRAARLDPKALAWPYYLGLADQALYDDEKAVAAFEAALSIDPTYAPVMVSLAGAIHEKDPTRSAALYRQAIEFNPGEARAYVGLAQRAKEANKLTEAIRFFRQALEIAPDYGQAHAALAELLASAGKTAEAEKHRREAKAGQEPPLVGDPLLVQLLGRSRNSEYLVNLAHRLVFANDFESALRLLRRALEESPKNRNAEEQIGVVLAMAGRHPEAADHFKAMLKSDRSNTIAQSHLAQVLVDMGKFDEAVKMYQDVLSFRPDEPFALEQIGWLQLVLGRPADAQGVLEKLAGLQPNDASSQFHLVVTLVCMKDYQQAVSGYRFAQGLMPDASEGCPRFVLRLLTLMALQKKLPSQGQEASRLTLDALSQLAERFQAAKMDREAKALKDPVSAMTDATLDWAGRGEYRRALSALESVMPLDQGGKFAAAMGGVLVMRQRYAEAEPWFRTALKADPASVAAKSNLGGVLTHLGKLQEAETLLREVVRDHPNHAAAMQQLGILLNRSGKTGEALAIWQRAVALQPNDATLRITLGNLLGRQGKYQEAIEQLKKALDIEPENAAVHYQLGVSLAAMGDAKGALSHWQRAMEVQPGHVEATSALAGVAAMKGDYAAAEKLLRDGLRLAPGSATFANGLAWILATCPEAGRRDGQAAVRWAKNACALSRNAPHKYLDTLAAAYAEAGQFEKAVETADLAVKVAEKAGDKEAANTYSGRMELFKAHQPYRDQKKNG